MTPFQAYLPEYNCIHVANFSLNSHTFSLTKSRLFLVDPSFTARSTTDGSRPDGNDFSWNTIFGNANTRVRVGIRVFQIEKEKRKRGPLSNRHAVVKDTQELRQERASNWKTSFSTFPLPLSSCFTLVASTHERFMGRVKDTRSVHRQFYNEITGGARRRFYMLNGIPPRYPVVHLRSATETTNFVPSLPLSIEGTPFSQVLVPFIDLISRKTGWGGPSPPLLFEGLRWFVKAEG